MPATRQRKLTTYDERQALRDDAVSSPYSRAETIQRETTEVE
jgi:hypothetical protein